MTKEQEEAIKILREIQECNRSWLKESKEENCEKIYLKDIEAIETILSMLEEKDNKIAELEKSVEQIYEDYQDIGKIAFDDGEKIEMLEKQIDLMAEMINNQDIDEDICKQMGQKENCNEFEEKSVCIECIKQYFENKVRQGSDKGATGK